MGDKPCTIGSSKYKNLKLKKKERKKERKKVLEYTAES